MEIIGKTLSRSGLGECKSTRVKSCFVASKHKQFKIIIVPKNYMKLIFLIFFIFSLAAAAPTKYKQSWSEHEKKVHRKYIYFSRIFYKKVAQRLPENYTTVKQYTEILYACYMHKTTFFLIVHVYYGYFYLFLDKRCQYRYTCSAEKSDESIPVTL